MEKCKFAQSEVRYLGHVVGSGMHAPDPNRIEAIVNLKRPNTKKELRSVLGLCNHYRDYVSHFSEIVFPLTQLTGKRIPNELPWGKEEQASFDALEQSPIKAPALFAPSLEREFVGATDASDHGVGACLSQCDDAGYERPIAFLSKKLRPVQQRWLTIEREAYAVVWALCRWDTWLYGTAIKVETDHNPLKYLTLTTRHSAKLTRWALALQRYDLTIEHRKGRDNGNADALSRLARSD